MRLERFAGMLRWVLVLGLGGILTAACGTDSTGDDGGGGGGGGGGGKKDYPVIEMLPPDMCQKSGDALANCKYQFDQGQVLVGEEIKTTLTIKNSGERNLLVKNVTMENYQAGVGAEEAGPAYRVELPPAFQAALDAGEKFYVAPAGEGNDTTPESLDIRVIFTRPEDDADRTADIVVDSDASNSPEVKIRLSTAQGFPKIQVAPEWVDFAQVGMGETKEQKINILNTGAADLSISGFKLSGSEYYTLVVQGTDYPVTAQTADPGVVFEDPIVIVPGNATFMKVRFEPKDDKPATATLILFSNDPAKVEGTEVKITGNESVPCIAVNPSKVNFGGKKYGEKAVVPLEISACGEAPLEIYNIFIKEGSSPDFDVDFSTLEAPPTQEAPVIVPIGASVLVNVVFVPDAPNPVSGDGTLILDTGSLIIENNSFDKEKEVPMSGAGVEIECPTAIIKCAEGEEVIPQTPLHLFGDESYASNGTIQKWEWDMDQPAGSQSVFVPSYTFPNPTFEANVAGVYTFYLTVYDQTNTPSCFPATYEVVVIPDEAIHIELLWNTPEDQDETDTGPEAGSDVDLHFLHPWAAGPDLDGDGAPDGYFDIPFDSFWFNAHPNWGSYDPAINDDPGLDRDDTDGAGPENINLDIPENVIYRVGVHYWNDHGYGAAYATIRVYIYAQLVFEVTDVMLVDSDLWEVCTVEWPSGKVQVITDEAGQYKIVPDYHNPYFFQ